MELHAKRAKDLDARAGYYAKYAAVNVPAKRAAATNRY